MLFGLTDKPAQARWLTDRPTVEASAQAAASRLDPVRTLDTTRLIAEVARQETPGHPRLFGTTLRFLQLVGLERIEDLPPVAESVVLPNFE